MWTCPLCQTRDNDDTSLVCKRCRLRQGAENVSCRSLCVLHATTAGAAAKIRKDGFAIPKTPTAGRSMGDALYGYVYGGGSVDGSVRHGVNAAEERNEKAFEVIQIGFTFEFSQVFVFDQPKWDMMCERLSNYHALIVATSWELAYVARAVRQEQVKARQKEIDELRKLGQSTIITAGNVDDVRPDHVAEAARRRGARAFLSLNDHSILFFRVEDLHADATWIAAPVPSRTDKDAVPKLFAESLLAAQERFADFCAEIEPHGTTQSAVLSTYTEVLSMFSQTDNTVTLCGGESVEVPLHAVPEHRPCELCTEQATCLLFQCSSCHRLVRSCAKHYSDLVNPSRVCPNHQK